MANIKINDIDQRVQYVATNLQTVFTIPFPFFANTDLEVYQDTTLLVLTTNYTVTGAGVQSGGALTLLVGATTGDIITITGVLPVDRTSIYSTVISNLTGSSLNNDLNRDVVMIKQQETQQQFMQLKYAPYVEISQTETVTTDRWLPLLGASETWRKNSGNTAIEAVVIPEFAAGFDADITADNRMVKTDFSSGTNLIQQTTVELTDANLMQTTAGDFSLGAAGDLRFEGVAWPSTGATTGFGLVLTSPTQTAWANIAFSTAPSTINAIPTYSTVNGDITPSGVSISGANAMTGLTAITIDNINIDGNTISSTDTNGDINISPDGTGVVIVNTVFRADNIRIDGSTIETTNTDGNINLIPNGTGEVDIPNANLQIVLGDLTVDAGDVELGAGNIVMAALATVDGRDVSVDGTKLDGIEALADVTDEANVTTAIDGATLTAVTVAGDDKVMIQDTDDADNLKTVTAQSIANLSVVSGNPNFLFNQTFAVAQRGTSFTSATSPANNDDTYLFDRWILLSDGNDSVDVTQETSTVPTGAGSAIKLEVETINTKFGIFQPLEALDSDAAIGGVVSISFDARNAAADDNTDVMKAAVVSWDSTADSITSDIISTWNADLTTPTLAANWTFENTPSDLALTQAYQTFTIENISVDTASTNNIGIFIWCDNGDGAVDDAVFISRVKMELGTNSTGLQTRKITEELEDCRRYFQSYTFNPTISIFASGWANSTSTATVAFRFTDVEMRTAPSISSTTATQFDIFYANANVAATGLTFNNITKLSSRLVVGVTGTPLTVGEGLGLTSNNTLATINISSEL